MSLLRVLPLVASSSTNQGRLSKTSTFSSYRATPPHRPFCVAKRFLLKRTTSPPYPDSIFSYPRSQYYLSLRPHNGILRHLVRCLPFAVNRRWKGHRELTLYPLLSLSSNSRIVNLAVAAITVLGGIASIFSTGGLYVLPS